MNIKTNQSGVASMVIVILIMTILTLIVLSMTQNANREQRQALDRQLNSQAFYAAESGIADLHDYITQNPLTAPVRKDLCEGLPGSSPGDQFPTKSAKVSNTDAFIRYSCVLYNREPKTLEFSNLGVSKPEILPIEDSDGRTLKSLTFTWTKKDGGRNFSGCPARTSLDLPQKLDNCEAGMLRIALINARLSTNRQSMLNNTFVAFARPSSSAGASTTTLSSASGTLEKQGAIIAGSCSVDKCTIKIDGINEKKLFLQLQSIYKTNRVIISGTTATNEDIKFSRAQVEVDSTGRANDVLKRISVRIKLSKLGGNALPGFTLQSNQDICKQLKLFPPNNIDDDC